MKKFLSVVLTIFKVIIALALVLELIYITMAVFNLNIDNKFRTERGRYGQNPTWLADSDSTEVDDLYARIATDGADDIAYEIYNLGCKKLMLSKNYGVRATSTITAKAGKYVIDVASNRTEQYEVAGTPVLNANQKVYSSYTNTIYVTNINDDALAGVLKNVIQFADRGYSDTENSYKQKGKLSVMEENEDGEGEEVIDWATTYETLDTSGDRKYKDDEIREKCNFIITKNTILPNSASVERVYDEKAGDYVYTVKFSLDCSDFSEGSATYYEVKALKDTLGENMRSITYTKLDIQFTVGSNGYMRSWHSIQEWTLLYAVSIFKLEGTATFDKSELFSYYAPECEVVNFTK